MSHDAIVIGAGHNGLIAAAYLARAGRKVLVLERRKRPGGACITEEIAPGFRSSRLAYVNSLLRPSIARDLKLREHGFRMLPRRPSSFTPFPDGRALILGPDRAENLEEIARFSRPDAEAFGRYEAMLERLAEVLEPLLDRPPPDPFSRPLRDGLRLARLAWRMRRLGPGGFTRLARLLLGPATPFLDEWFESEELKTTLATDAIIGAFAAPSTPGTAYVLFHHVMGECDGARGVWGYVRGGLGALTDALLSVGRELGVEVRAGTPVARVLLEHERAAGVVTESGEELRARSVLSSADPRVTFLKLLDPERLPEELRRRIETLDFSSGVFKLNLALSRLPSFRARPGYEPGPWHRGTIHLAPDRESIERAFEDARRGRPSERPVLELTIPSVVDDTLAPPGAHVMGVFAQYAPYRLAEGDWESERERFADRCIDLIEEAAPGFRDSIVARDAISPLDLEREFSLTGGNIFHGAMTADQLFFLRPAAGYARHATPIDGLWLAGAGAHPGGGVLGASGRNAALEVLRRGR